MAEIILSDAEKRFILHGVEDGIRCDGRGCCDYRPIEIETDVVSNTNGSARVRLAKSDVLVGIKAELDAPLSAKPEEGRLEFFVDCSANATPEFEGRGGEDIAMEVTTALTRAYSSPNTVNLKALSVIPGLQSWVLYVDIVVLECGGNLVDTVSLAVKAALFNTKIPKVRVTVEETGHPEIEISDDPFDCERIDVHNTPVIVTVAQIGSHYVVDPTLEEEACSRGSIIMAVNEQGYFCCLRKTGSGSIHPESLFDILQTGKDIGQTLNKRLMKKLKEEEALGTKKEQRGFLN